MRFASLGSGSEGNALIVEAHSGSTTTRVLLDCGFSAKEFERRFARLDCGIEQLDAILITHEHSDHIGGALTVARKWAVPVYASWGTARAIGADEADVDLHVLTGEQTVAIGDLEVRAYTVPHDAREPLQFIFSDGAYRLGVLTDVGMSTPHITSVLGVCDGLVLECNHDVGMLAASRYPPSLKARISGSHGHLSNDAAAAVLASLDCTRLQHVVAAHLSQQNNLPERARSALAGALCAAGDDVVVASQEDGFGWLALRNA